MAVLVDQLLGAAVVQEAERRAGLRAAAHGLLGLTPVSRAVADIQDRRVDDDHLFAGALLGQPDRVLHARLLLQHAHDRIHAMGEEGLKQRHAALAVVIAPLDLVIGRGRGMAPAEDPVGTDDHAGERNARHLGPGELSQAH